MERSTANVLGLSTPRPPIPMPGDRVFWFSDAKPFAGELLGHNVRCEPVIKNDFGNQVAVNSFNQIRLENPSVQVGPNWLRLPTCGKAWSVLPDELRRFDKLLSQRIPPGPQYFELSTELWQRGFEVFLVGGTVRDVISGTESFDVDLVTTMPLNLILPLVESMYRYRPSVSERSGFVRIGGKPGSGDPFIDLKIFSTFQPGTASAVFGSSFELDVAHRDFTCNAVYYEPVHKILIDPTGLGASDSARRVLRIACNSQYKNSYEHATIVIRFFKFACRGFTCSPETKALLVNAFAPNLFAMKKALRVKYVRTQLLNKQPETEHESIIEEFKSEMISFGLQDHWDKLFEPIVQDILAGRRKR